MTANGDIWSSLPSIGLEELDRLAALQTRVDRKYVVPPEVVEELIEGLGSDLRVLDIDGRRRFEYETVYFDTEGLDFYLAAARSRPKRFKVRTRTYLDSHQSALEVKVRDGRERTVKHRLRYPFEDRDRLTVAGRRYVGMIVRAGDTRLRPVLCSRYARRSVMLQDAGIRATIDTEYRCEDLATGGRAALPGAVIVETKSAGRAGPLDHLLWQAGHRPARISKYCTGLAVTRGLLPANKWHRTITRHMALVGVSEPTSSADPGASQMASICSR